MPNWHADLTHVILSPRRGTAPTQCAARPAAHCVDEHRQPANAKRWVFLPIRRSTRSRSRHEFGSELNKQICTSKKIPLVFHHVIARGARGRAGQQRSARADDRTLRLLSPALSLASAAEPFAFANGDVQAVARYNRCALGLHKAAIGSVAPHLCMGCSVGLTLIHTAIRHNPKHGMLATACILMCGNA
jgi:hypothetical protein